MATQPIPFELDLISLNAVKKGFPNIRNPVVHLRQGAVQVVDVFVQTWEAITLPDPRDETKMLTYIDRGLVNVQAGLSLSDLLKR